MKTLYESILSTTNSGRHAKVTVNLLMSLGWKKKGRDELVHPENSHTFEYNDDDIVFGIVYDFDGYKYKCRIRTIEDFDRLKQFWDEWNKAYKENPWNEDKKRKDALKALDYFLKSLGKGDYNKTKY